MTTHLGKDVHQPSMARPGRGRRGTTAWWILRAVSGALLVLLLGVHIVVAKHFVAKGGLRDFAQVVSYIRNPFVLVIESLFLIVVTWHAMRGVRAVLFDLGFSRCAETLITRSLAVLGVATVGYGFWLIATIASKGRC